MNNALRSLRRSPGFAALAVLTIALGAGAATAVFSVVDAVLLRPLPYPDAERLVMVWETRASSGRAAQNVTPAVLQAWRERARSFESIAGAVLQSPILRHHDENERVNGLRVSANLFDTLKVAPALGRAFQSGEDVYGAPRVAILSDSLWRRRFSADAGILGTAILLDGHPHTVVGVMPPGFRMQPAWAALAEIWTPMALDPRLATSWSFAALRSYARLKPDVTLANAQRELDGIAAQLNAESPGQAGGRGAVAERLIDRTVGNVRQVLLLLLATVSCLLLVACANLANLLLIRASRREKDLAVRAALGASRPRLAWHLTGESLLSGAIGALLAIALAAWGLEWLPSLLPESAQSVLPRLHEIRIDLRVAAFAVAAAMATSVLASLAPGFRFFRAAQQPSLQYSTRSATANRHSTRLRTMLVAGEAALTLVLLCGVALLLRSFIHLLSVDPGFRVANTLTFVISQPQNLAGNELLRPSTVDQLRQRLAALPGVRSAAAVNHIPVAGDEWGTTFHIPGVTPEDRFQRPRAIWRLIDPHYLTTMGMTLRSGRPFGLHDTAGAEAVALINQALASRWFPNQNPVGQAFFLDGSERRTIVGVFADTRQRVWGEPADFEILLPVAQEKDWTRTRFISFALHTSGDPSTFFETVRRTVSEFNPNLALYDMATMDQVRSAAVARPRFTLSLLCGLAAVTLALAIVGLFAVVSFSVATRTREFGIRSALGAQSRQIVAQVVREGLLPVGAGALAGLAGALLLMRHYRDLLYRVDPADPLALGGAVALILCVALAACWLPARRASHVHPATVLRDE